jgi:hypothetical protein
MTTASVSPGVLAHARIGTGIIGGLVGGVMFGILMQMMDMIPMVAMLVGSEAVAVGWLVHLAISAFIGATFAVLFGRYATSVGSSTAIGLGYGIVWWVRPRWNAPRRSRTEPGAWPRSTSSATFPPRRWTPSPPPCP